MPTRLFIISLPQVPLLMMKLHLRDAEFVQEPFVFIPNSRFHLLAPGGPVSCALRNGFSVHQTTEFRKTAEALGMLPWNIQKAVNYLLGLIANNEAGAAPSSWISLTISCIWEPTRLGRASNAILVDEATFAVRQPNPWRPSFCS